MDIYQPHDDSYLLEKYVKAHAFGRVLDMGTGSGIQALSAIKLEKVRFVTAVDINPLVIKTLKEKISSENIQKMNVVESDLFSNVTEKFETVIFNPPYLPQDKIGDTVIEDMALYGGVKGWETTVSFLEQVGDYLSEKGQILLLFSSLTNKEKIEETLLQQMFTFEELESKNLPMMEILYVYLIKQNSIRKRLVSHSVKNISYHAKGNRGLVFKARWDKNSFEKKFLASKDEVQVAIKVTNPDSKAVNRITNEINFLKIVNRRNIGPKLYFSGEDFLVMEFIDGIPLYSYLEQNTDNKQLVKKVILQLLEICFTLDILKITKEELHRPNSNVLVNERGNVRLIDFERCTPSPNPQNVTQFCSFLIHSGYLPKDVGIVLSQEYKEKYSSAIFDKIIETFKKTIDHSE